MKPIVPVRYAVALEGVLLFLFIPLVLILYLRLPLGLAPSLLGGMAIMIGHRFVARPWMERRLAKRCFWCGKGIGEREGVDAGFTSGGMPVAAKACTVEHRDALHSFARVVTAAKPAIVLLIALPVAFYLVNGLLAIVHVRLVPLATAAWIFKIPVAACVVALSFAAPLGRRLTRPPAIDIPVHNLFLLGVRSTFWVFRVVGVWWLAWGLWVAVAR